jgi:hypothetical protein
VKRGDGVDHGMQAGEPVWCLIRAVDAKGVKQGVRFRD